MAESVGYVNLGHGDRCLWIQTVGYGILQEGGPSEGHGELPSSILVSPAFHLMRSFTSASGDSEDFLPKWCSVRIVHRTSECCLSFLLTLCMLLYNFHDRPKRL